MTGSASAHRAEILAMLASFGDRRPEQIPEEIDSLELAWLAHQIEERHTGRITLDETDLVRMTSVTAAAEVLRDLLSEAVDD